MISVGLFEAKLEALEMHMDVNLRALFEEFRLGRSPSPIRSQRGANLDCKKNLSEELAMICHTSTIQEYQTRFERKKLKRDSRTHFRQPSPLRDIKRSN
ncbi:hypothetical protein B296_00055071 [Ensete ventricosum]|uniref:Uncharacterized protein n=1 Tax=Ensete ventricosum TaxID=4639 RepID=A0A426WVK0_ENSVE|nr:hypothetical protein B296_00055071 [Ensete ventricosum]